jgi:hypothetical protein
VKYAYDCPACGEFDSTVGADRLDCRCGRSARRRFSVAVNRSSLKSESRWDPVVGAYVANDREFRSLLARGQEAESEKLNMDVKLETLDARDSEGLAELHGWKDREADLEATKRHEHDKART